MNKDRDDGTDIHDSDDGTEVRNPFVFETHAEADLIDLGPMGEDRRTVSPGEEGPVTQGFQHGSWDYNQGAEGQYGANLPSEAENEDPGEANTSRQQ